MLKSLFLSLANREVSKGGTHFYSAVSASTTLSFFILLNLWSALLIGELFLGSVFTQINNVIFSQNYYVTTALVSFSLIVATLYFRYQKLDLLPLANRQQTGITKFVTYGVISGIIFIVVLFWSI